jgi:flagellar hook-length control protein FliK
VAINTNTLTLGSAMPAKTNPSLRADNSSADVSPGAQANSAGTSGADPAGTAPGGANNQSSSSTAGTAPGPKSAGPSAQTRGNARPTRARSTAAANTAAGQAGSDAPDAAAQSSADFGSVMASALGRGAASTNQGSAPVNAATATTDSATATPPPQSAISAPPAAVGWFAQAFLPPAPGAQAPATADATDPTGNAIGAVGADAQAPRALAVQLAAQNAVQNAAQNALTGAQASDNAAVTPGSTPASPAIPAMLTNDAALSAAVAAPAGNLTALADVQKLIAGLSGANPTGAEADTDADADAPKTHATPDGGGTDAAPAAAALQAASLTRANGSLGGATLTIHAPVGSAAFADEVGMRAAGLAQSGITQAQLQLNPADLGPVQVHITMQAGQASVWFGASHADTRAALEQSLPRLRELFAGAGMPLSDSGVFREPPQQQQAPSLPSAGSSPVALSDTTVAPTVTQVANIRLSLLDTYA